MAFVILCISRLDYVKYIILVTDRTNTKSQNIYLKVIKAQGQIHNDPYLILS